MEISCPNPFLKQGQHHSSLGLCPRASGLSPRTETPCLHGKGCLLGAVSGATTCAGASSALTVPVGAGLATVSPGPPWARGDALGTLVPPCLQLSKPCFCILATRTPSPHIHVFHPPSLEPPWVCFCLLMSPLQWGSSNHMQCPDVALPVPNKEEE